MWPISRSAPKIILKLQPATIPSTPGRATVPSIPQRVFAPYQGVWTLDSSPSIIRNVGLNWMVLAFVTANNRGIAAWNGEPLSRDPNAGMFQRIKQIRDAGADVIVSFGGAAGTEIATAHTDPLVIMREYEKSVTFYNARWLDFDIEGSHLDQLNVVRRRNEALVMLKRAHPTIKLSLTVPVAPNGLLQNALNLLEDAKSKGLYFDIVNIMAMNYGESNQNMGQTAINAAQGTLAQLRRLSIPSKIGVTPMLGQNDTPREVFGLADARLLVSYALNPANQITFLSFWALYRDNNNSKDYNESSLVSQSPFDFSRIFAQFKG